MTETLMQPLAIYDVASRVGASQTSPRLNESRGVYLVHPKLPLNYAGLRQILAAQNASVDLIFLAADLFEVQGIDGVVTGGWGISPRVNRAFGILTGSPVVHPGKPEEARQISLFEAQHLAIAALLRAEERRQTEREHEAAFWAMLED